MSDFHFWLIKGNEDRLVAVYEEVWLKIFGMAKTGRIEGRSSRAIGVRRRKKGRRGLIRI